MMRVLVVGGTGALGAPVVKVLTANGFQVGVGTRQAQRAAKMFGAEIEPVELDMQDAASIRTALNGWDALHLNLPSGPRFEDCFRNESQAVRNLAGVIKSSSIRRVSYLSGATVSDRTDFPPAQAKWLAEEALRRCGVPFTIWRATWFMESLHRLYRFGILARPGSGQVAVHWLAGMDFGLLVAKSLVTPDAENRTFYAYGPEKLSFREALGIFRRRFHPMAPIVPLPISLIIKLSRTAGLWEMWFGGQLMRHLADNPEPGSPNETFNLFGRPKTTLEDFI